MRLWTLLWVAASSSCFETEAPSHALDLALRLAGPEPEWKAGLSLSRWSTAEAALLGSASGELSAGLGEDARAAWWVSATDSPTERVGISFEGAQKVKPQLVRGVAVFMDAWPQTDVLMSVDARRAEVFLVLREASAPRRWRWKVTLPAGLSAHWGGDAVEFRRGGTARLRIPAPRARDATGRSIPVSMRWTGAALELALAEIPVAFPVLVDPVLEVLDWERKTRGGRYSHAQAYDAVRNRVVVFGGWGSEPSDETWEWDGIAWTQRSPPVSPPPRGGSAIAFDSARGRVVLFGGVYSNYLTDTWEWDGTTWARVNTPISPPPMQYPAMAYDAARMRMVLFGGDSYGTWEFDGVSWTRRTPSTSPPGSQRAEFGMAYDAVRSRVVLFGGRQGTANYSSETWEWDGTSWTQRSPSVSPPARAIWNMSWDTMRSRVVLFGGMGVTGALADTWEWDGMVWTQRSPTNSPSPRSAHGTAYDIARGRLVLFGGWGLGALRDTWEWDGVNWVERVPGTVPGRWAGAMAYDSLRARTLLFGGYVSDMGDYNRHTVLGDTWAWDGTAWIALTPTTSPPARYRHAVAYDAARDRLVLFGGRNSLSDLGDTWEWDGTAWRLRSPTSSPSPRNGHALAYDSARGRVVLFAGSDVDIKKS